MIPTSDLHQAAALLRAGGLVAFPTETVYGLGADALNAAAVGRIYAAKGRPSTSPLIVHVTGPAMARTLVANWPEAAELLARAFWPGPLTLVLPKQPQVPDAVTAGLGSVGVRQPAHPVAAALLEAAGIPIAAPSANRFMQLSPTTAAHVREGLGEAVDLILDGGACAVGIESTVLSLATSPPVLLRPGMVTREQIEAVIGPIAIAGPAADGEAHAAPGQHSRHYSPRTPLRLGAPGPGDAYLWHSTPAPAAAALRLPADPEGYAAGLYDALHRLDAAAAPFIAVEPVPETPAWDGIADRLRRAAVR